MKRAGVIFVSTLSSIFNIIIVVRPRSWKSCYLRCAIPKAFGTVLALFQTNIIEKQSTRKVSDFKTNVLRILFSKTSENNLKQN